MYIAKALSSISFLIFAATLSTSNNAPHHIVSLPKFLSPAALARICHVNSGSSLIIEDDSEKAADGLEWERRAHSFGDMKHLMNSQFRPIHTITVFLLLLLVVVMAIPPRQ